MIILYLLVISALAIYSYSQIDLNLTISSQPIFLSFQKAMINLGYYERPFSTAIFIILLACLFILWILLYRCATSGKVTLKQLVALGIGVSLLGLISYPAFSYDFFNYLFYARIILHYGQNPYLVTPLDFPFDPWVRFMHWVHAPYPYGPFWLLLSLLPSFLGAGKFVLTVMTFKILFIGFYLGNLYLIKKIVQRLSPERIKSALVFFAFNPLVIIEAVINPHVDAAMTFFLMASLYFLSANKRSQALISLFLSAGIKFLTLLLIPAYFLRSLSFEKGIKLMVLISLLSLIPVIWLREFYPWYFLPTLGLLSLLKLSANTFKVVAAVLVGLLLQYAPYFYVGSYPAQVQLAKNILVFLPVTAALLAIYGPKVIKSR